MANNSIIDAVTVTTYREFDKLRELYEGTEGLDNCLHLMTPNVLSTIIINASDNLSELCIRAMNYIYEQNCHNFSNSLRVQLMPTLNIQRDFRDYLLSEAGDLQLELGHYEVIYGNAIERINSARSGMKLFGAAAVGGVIGSLFGPIGTIIGGMAGSSMSGGSSNEELSTVSHLLCTEFLNMADSINEYLEHMGNKTLKNIEEYKQLCSNNIE